MSVFIVAVLLFSAYALAALFNGPPANLSCYDYIVVGGGTSGLVVANRLSEDPHVTVAVLEAGASVYNNTNVTTVGEYGLALGTAIDWAYESEPQEFADDQNVVYHQGKALGGTSTINGMTYVRSAVAQIDSWQRLGNAGWNWSTLYPYYLKSEKFQIPTAAQQQQGITYNISVHGRSGNVDVGWLNNVLDNDTHVQLQAAWGDVGIPFSIDPNTGDPEGFSAWPMTMNQALNIRWDAARAYYWPVKDRNNLDVYQNSFVQRLSWSQEKDCDLAVADGVVVADSRGATSLVKANKEVILSAGAFKSPAILEMSGVGNAVILGQHGIASVVDLPSVGSNLQDQSLNAIQNVAKSGVNFTGYPTYVTYANAKDLFGKNLTNVEEHVRKSIGDYAETIVAHQAPNATSKEVQQTLLGIQADLIFKDLIPVAELLSAPVSTSIVVPFWGLLPFSKGSSHITSANSSSSGTPAINPNFFMLEWDLLLQTAAARLTRSALGSSGLADLIGMETAPTYANISSNATPEQWGVFFKKSFSPNYHPCGTAAMMARDLGGVVDPNLVVYGTKNVRVVDASSLPGQVIGHLTSTLYAVAEMASDRIKGRI